MTNYPRPFVIRVSSLGFPWSLVGHWSISHSHRERAIRGNRNQRWAELTALLDSVGRRGASVLEVDQIKRLCSLYRQVTIDLSQARAAGDDPAVIAYLNA